MEWPVDYELQSDLKIEFKTIWAVATMIFPKSWLAHKMIVLSISIITRDWTYSVYWTAWMYLRSLWTSKVQNKHYS